MSKKRLDDERAPKGSRQAARPAPGSAKPRRKADPAAAAVATSSSGIAKTEDVALICGKTADGSGLHVLRKRGDRVETGLIQPLREGKPIDGSVVRLRPRPDFPLLCDVDVEFEMPEREPTEHQATERRSAERIESSGPPQIATADYRKNWDLIWNRSANKHRSVN